MIVYVATAIWAVFLFFVPFSSHTTSRRTAFELASPAPYSNEQRIFQNTSNRQTPPSNAMTSRKACQEALQNVRQHHYQPSALDKQLAVSPHLLHLAPSLFNKFHEFLQLRLYLSCVGADATFECVATATLSLKQLGKDLRRDGAALSFHTEERVSAMLQHEPSYLQLVEEKILLPGEWTR
jgi:hypothetical protein